MYYIVVEAESGKSTPTVDPNVCEDQPGHDCQQYLKYCSNTQTKVPELCKKSCGLCGGDDAAGTTKATTVATTEAATTTTQAPEVVAKEVSESAEETCEFFKYEIFHNF